MLLTFIRPKWLPGGKTLVANTKDLRHEIYVEQGNNNKSFSGTLFDVSYKLPVIICELHEVPGSGSDMRILSGYSSIGNYHELRMSADKGFRMNIIPAENVKELLFNSA